MADIHSGDELVPLRRGQAGEGEVRQAMWPGSGGGAGVPRAQGGSAFSWRPTPDVSGNRAGPHAGL